MKSRRRSCISAARGPRRRRGRRQPGAARPDHAVVRLRDAQRERRERARPELRARLPEHHGQRHLLAHDRAELRSWRPTELAAGNAPDLLATRRRAAARRSRSASSRRPAYLAPTREGAVAEAVAPARDLREQVRTGTLRASSPTVSPFGIFTNDTLFKKLGLTVPQTFSQLLGVCQKAKADGTSAMVLGAARAGRRAQLISDLAIATVYGKDKHWAAELKAGKVTFDGTPGWHQALQEFVDMNNAGCFEPGPGRDDEHRRGRPVRPGQSLMMVNLSTHEGHVDAAEPAVHLLLPSVPGRNRPEHRRRTSSASAPAQRQRTRERRRTRRRRRTFIDFIARPKQDALYAQIVGGPHAVRVPEGADPARHVRASTPVVQAARVRHEPVQTWWNADVGTLLSSNGDRADHRAEDDRPGPERDGRRLEARAVLRFYGRRCEQLARAGGRDDVALLLAELERARDGRVRRGRRCPPPAAPRRARARRALCRLRLAVSAPATARSASSTASALRPSCAASRASMASRRRAVRVPFVTGRLRYSAANRSASSQRPSSQ